MKVIIGNITFEGKKAIVHEINGIIDCTDHNVVGKTPEQVAGELGEQLSNVFLAFVIPEIWGKNGGTILYECDMSLDVHPSEYWVDDDTPDYEEKENWFYSHDAEWQNDIEGEHSNTEGATETNLVLWAWDKYHVEE